ncbi:MAG TPA: hypothetical protein VMR74_09315 [Gammaproteobacteria bacterium]|nr:hypothetical protein [Gammaproteobacteria bacterium]
MTEPSYCRANDLGLIRVAGRDARQFLHAQTTQSLIDLPANGTRLAAWLTAKGRVRALFDVVAEDDTLWLVTEAESADWLTAEMARFVLRSDVRLEVVNDRAVYSLLGDSNRWLRDRGIGLAPRAAAAALGALWFRMAPGRIDVVADPDTLEPELAGLATANPDAAALAAIQAGRPAVPAVLRERYIPQMLNLERLDAVSFTKGCYPGQEIVARTQNLGEVKRRLARFRCGPGPRPEPAAPIVDQASQDAGEINRAAATDDGYELLAVTRIDAAGTELALASDGRTLQPLPLL